MSTAEHHITFMQLALEQAKLAEQLGEVPVGAVIVLDGQVIAVGHNKSIMQSDASLHAEIDAMRQASLKLSNYRLVNCELYVTLEPCMMCLGAMLHSRIKKLYYGASDPKTGALGGLINLQEYYKVNHAIEIYPNIHPQPCSDILKNFFKQKR
jgi:tRNA(adenine34) deaminase